MKGHHKIFATRNSKLWPLFRSVPVRQRLTPVTGTFWFPHALCKIRYAHSSMAAKCQVLHFSAWRQSETLAGKALGFTFEVHTVQESRPRRGSCQAVSNSRCEESCMLPLLVPSAPHSSTSLTWPCSWEKLTLRLLEGWQGCFFPACCSKWCLREKGGWVGNFRAGWKSSDKLDCSLEFRSSPEGGNVDKNGISRTFQIRI